MTKRVQNWSKVGSWNPGSKKVNLSEAVPLDTPFLVYIDPSSICNFKCRFCPTGHPDLLKKVGRPLKLMDYDLYVKVLDDLVAFPKKTRALFFHKDGEPLMNPRLGEMLALAVEKNVSEKYWLTTNASLLNPQCSSEIVASGIDAVRLSIEHVNSDGYKNLTRTFSDYIKLLKSVASLWEARERSGSHMKIFAKLIDFNFSEEQIEKFAQDFGPITDDVLLTQPNGWTRNEVYDFTLGVKPKGGYDGDSRLAPERIACINPFYNIAVNADGQVGLCPLDWSLATVIGDVRQNSLLDIWNSRRAREFQVLQLSGRRHENAACKNCECIPYSPESELDPALDKLLPKFVALLHDAH